MVNPLPQRPEGRAFRALRDVALVVFLGAVFGGMYLIPFPGMEDINPEEFQVPLVAACIRTAHSTGQTPPQFFKTNPLIQHMKEQNPWPLHDCYLDRFILDHVMYSVPLEVATYIPFDRCFGVSMAVVESYSVFFAACTMLVTALLAASMFGRLHLVATSFALFTSLCWIIHVKVACPQPFLSTTLMVLLMFALFKYAITRARRWTLVAGFILGLAYLAAWIVFAYALIATGLTLLFLGHRHPLGVVVDGLSAATTAVATAAIGVAAYAAWCQIPVTDVHESLWAFYFARFNQGQPGVNDLTVGEKMAYAFRCMFLDMQTIDHSDKYLEGYPGIPFLTTAVFLVGLVYSIKDRTTADRILLIWLVSAFSLLGTVFTYAHRYALMGLPAVAILAARGGLGIWNDFQRSGWKFASVVWGALLAIGLALSVFVTHRQYYVDFQRHKPPNFEQDRLRGHAAFAQWLLRHGSPADTLVVFGDPVMFPDLDFVFHTWPNTYRYLFWSNAFSGREPVQVVRQFEEMTFRQYRRIVYAFSTQLASHPWFRFGNNDWSSFREAHLGLQPSWSYSYSGRPPSILLFEVSRPSPKPAHSGSPRRTKNPKEATPATP